MTKSMLLSIPIMGEFSDTKPFWGALLHTISGPLDLLVIDNGAFRPVEDKLHRPDYFLENFIKPHWPGDVFYHPQDDNLGVIQSMQYTFEGFEHDILAFLHNDVYIYGSYWDLAVKEIFEKEEKCGLVGFFGAVGVSEHSGRFHVLNNMLEAEVHGMRVDDKPYEVAVLDGLSMFASREMLAERDGVDTEFAIHHFYDLDLSLESIDRGYRNFYIPIPIHHQSGLTATRPFFNEWANQKYGMDHAEQVLYQNNLALWKKKWAHRLPWQVGEAWG